MYILRIEDNLKVKCGILPVEKDTIPKKKEGWLFNWSKAYRKNPNTIFMLVEEESRKLHGLVQLIQDEGMLIMELIEIAPFNFGLNKEYKNVAGCLIAFGCKESLKLNTDYKGYLTFISKTELIPMYKTKYYATQTIGARMYIGPLSGENLINEYLSYDD